MLPALARVNFSGGFLQGSWNHRYSGRSDTTLLISYQRYAGINVLEEPGAHSMSISNTISPSANASSSSGDSTIAVPIRKRNQLSPSR